MNIDMRKLFIQVDDMIDELSNVSESDKDFDARLKIACTIIQGNAIHELADAVQCITTGTNQVMGIAESMQLIMEKIHMPDYSSEFGEISENISEIAESIKGLDYD